MVVKSLENKFLRNTPFFSGLPESDINSFSKYIYTRDYEKNEYIYHQGDEADRVFIVINGWVRVYRETIDGDESVPALLTTEEIFGEGAIYYQSNHYIFSAQAIEKTRLLEISQTMMRRSAEANPDIMRRIMASVCQKMIRLQTENEHLANMKASQRVACLLLRLSSHMIGSGGTFTFPYDKSLAAAQLGMKRETFSRALTHLRPLGVTVSGPEVKVESFKRLTEYSCKHCALSAGQCAGARYSICGLHEGWKKTSAIRSHSSHGA